MKVKTLVNAMMYKFDFAELYDINMNLQWVMNPETLMSEYENCQVKKFNIHQCHKGIILEVILK